jgi:hypothetical protein
VQKKISESMAVLKNDEIVPRRGTSEYTKKYPNRFSVSFSNGTYMRAMKLAIKMGVKFSELHRIAMMQYINDAEKREKSENTENK